MTKAQKLGILLVILVAIFFRFYKITEMPGGLFPDEAANGLDILSMEKGDIQPFYERGNGREALFFYMLWGSIKVFGIGPWQHHIVSALVGVLSVILCMGVTRRLWLLAGSKTQTATCAMLFAGFIMAANSWYTVLSRTAFRANLIPLFTGLSVYLLLRTYTAKKNLTTLFATLSGIALALGLYTYIAYRIFLPIIAVAVAFALIVKLYKDGGFSYIKTWVKPFIALVLAFIVTFGPLAWYFISHEGSFVGRSGQVSVFNPELNGGDLIGTILEVSRLSFFGYFTHGDLNWRHNISGAPFLEIFISPIFLVGLLLTIWRTLRYLYSPIKQNKYWREFLLAAWFFGLLVPVVTTAEGIPHGLRSIGTIPAVFIITTIGASYLGSLLVQLSEYCKKRSLKGKKFKIFYNKKPIGWYISAAFVPTIAGVIGLALVLNTYTLYFIDAYDSPENFYAFRSDLTAVTKYLMENGTKEDTYLVLDKFSIQTPDYMTARRNQPYTQVEPEYSYLLPEMHNLKPGDKVVFTQSTVFDIKKFKEYNPYTRLVHEERNKFGQAVVAVYEIP